MNRITNLVMTILASGAIFSMANDVFQWSVSNTPPASSASFAERALEMALNLPIKILQALVNIALGVLESVLRMIFGIVGLGDKINFDPITL